MNKGYIVKKDGVWVVAELADSFDDYNQFGYNGVFYKNPILIHPDHINTVIENGCVKPEYQGEVVYEVKEESVQSISTEGDYLRSYTIETYAIPKPIESKADVWEVLHSDSGSEDAQIHALTNRSNILFIRQGNNTITVYPSQFEKITSLINKITLTKKQ